MIGRVLLVATLSATVLTLSGCVVGDGIAYVVKAAENSQRRSTAAPQAAPAPTPTAATADDGPQPAAPLPAPRDAISVEQLPAPR